MIIDIHTHTYPTSDDSTLTPEQLIKQSKHAGLDGICLTDHDGFWEPKENHADAETTPTNDFMLNTFDCKKILCF